MVNSLGFEKDKLNKVTLMVDQMFKKKKNSKNTKPESLTVVNKLFGLNAA